MSDFYQKALQNFNGTLYMDAIIPNRTPQLTASQGVGQGITYRSMESSAVRAQTKQIISLQPATATPANLLDSGLVDFRLEKGFVDDLDHIYVIVMVTNNTGATMTIQPSQLLLNRWEVYGDNGNTLLFQEYAHESWLKNIYFSFQDWNVLAPFFLTNSSYSTAGTVIANTASLIFYIPLVAFFTPLKLHLSALAGQLLIRLRFDSWANNGIVPSSGPPTCNSITLQLRGRQLSNKIRDEGNKTYRTLPLSLPYTGVQRMSQQLTLATNSTYVIVLSGLRGIAATFQFILRAVPITAANEASYIQVASFDLQNQNGESILGYYRRNYADMTIELAESFDSLFPNFVNAHFVVFSDNPVADYTSGSNNGYQCFTSFEKLSFTTTATITPGNFQLDMYASCKEFALINNGIITTTRN